MDTNYNIIEIKSEKNEEPLHQHAKDMETDEPTCLIHLTVQKSKDIQIIERMNLPSVKSERCIDEEYIKQEQLGDIKRDSCMSVNNIKLEELEGVDIENDGFAYVEYREVANRDSELQEGIKPEIEEQINIERDRFTYRNGETGTADNIKTKEIEDAARDKKRSLAGKHFECNICQRSFTHRGNLNGHLRTHTGEKPFECAICQRGFAAKCDLSKHLKIHTGEKPFECQTCQRRFSQRYSLNAHLRIHTGEKPFECKMCQRTFCRRSSLSTHIKTHAEKSFECETCKQKFAFNGHYCPGPPLPPYIPIDPDLITQVPHVEYVGVPRVP